MIRSTSFLIFFLFATMAGWVIDSLYRSLMERRWVNAGYFTGPFCPIYGFGGLLLLLMVSYISDIPLLLRCIFYFIGMSMVEFLGGVFTTSVLKVRLWDYSHAPFNILGHVDLLHSTYWLVLALIFEGTVLPVIEFLNGRAALIGQWLDLVIFTFAVLAMTAALLRNMVKERKRIRPFHSETAPVPIRKHLEEINTMYERMMGRIDENIVSPSERDTKEWFDRHEHYLEDLSNDIGKLKVEVSKIRGSVHLGPMEKDLKRISKMVNDRKRELGSLRKRSGTSLMENIDGSIFKARVARMKKGSIRMLSRSRKRIEWQTYILLRGHSFHPLAFLDRFPNWQLGWKRRKDDLLLLIRNKN